MGEFMRSRGNPNLVAGLMPARLGRIALLGKVRLRIGDGQRIGLVLYLQPYGRGAGRGCDKQVARIERTELLRQDTGSIAARVAVRYRQQTPAATPANVVDASPVECCERISSRNGYVR
jgi:hypothetical protein